MFMPCSDTCFQKLSTHLSLKVVAKGFFRDKVIQMLVFLSLFSKAKTEECLQEDWFVSDKFSISIPFSSAYFLKVCAPVSEGLLEIKKFWRVE